MNIILFDGDEWENMRPLTLTKPFGELRIGVLSFKERWMKYLGGNYSYLTRDYLSKKYPTHIENRNVFINSAFFPNEMLAEAISKLDEGETLWQKEVLVAACMMDTEDFKNKKFSETKKKLNSVAVHIRHLWELFIYNEFAIRHDFDLLTKDRESQPIPDGNRVVNPENIFLEEGAIVEYSSLNASKGPIYIGEGAEIMEGSLIRGGLALCEGGKINMGTIVYPGTTIGPHSKVGGELNNAILMGYSNKSHSGFLGNSVLGEWCNLGAGTNNSNLKNNYADVKLWDYNQKKYLNTGLQFCGLFMADYSKSAINTQFNTGTVVGVSSNIFKPGFPPNFVNSFNWGGSRDSSRFELNTSFDAAAKMMARREKLLTDKDKKILEHIFNETAQY